MASGPEGMGAGGGGRDRWNHGAPSGRPFNFDVGNLPIRRIVAIVAVLIVIGLAVFFVKSGRGGLVDVADTEVAVIVNYITGNSRLVEQPGYQIFLPFFEQAFLFDASPNLFLMEGERDIDPNHVKKLTVRANDGSNFWFETLEIQYRLVPARAPYLLHDSGPGTGFKQNWVRAFARSVLRDEFGRYSAEEVADPTSYKIATQKATQRLNDLLQVHGVEIIQIITPKPKFDALYEKAIEDRKVANQEVEKLKIKQEQLQRERERRLASIDRDKATEYEQLLGTLEANRIAAEKSRVQVEKAADAHKIEQVNYGRALEQELLARAGAREAQARKEAEGLNARVEALAARGEILVREALAEKLAQIRFSIVPYRRDPAPVRIEHMGAATVKPAEENR